MIHHCLISTPLGDMCLTEENDCIVSFLWGGSGNDETPLLTEAAQQLSDYFAGHRRTFDLPLAPKGTDFQQSVWRALTEIPYGETRSYGEIAKALGNPNASRAVGMANHRNPIPIIIPCHRVIGADGSLTGYGGGLPRKKYLLALEASSP